MDSSIKDHARWIDKLPFIASAKPQTSTATFVNVHHDEVTTPKFDQQNRASTKLPRPQPQLQEGIYVIAQAKTIITYHAVIMHIINYRTGRRQHQHVCNHTDDTTSQGMCCRTFNCTRCKNTTMNQEQQSDNKRTTESTPQNNNTTSSTNQFKWVLVVWSESKLSDSSLELPPRIPQFPREGSQVAPGVGGVPRRVASCILQQLVLSCLASGPILLQ